MKPKILTIKNFRAFREKQTFTFPTEPGLYFMQGVNQVDDRLGANGAGKSSIWEALHWLIFNKTSTGLKAGDICNWEAEKGVEVSLLYGDQQNWWEVTRTWGPISWTMSLTEDDFSHPPVDLTKQADNSFLADLKLDATTYLHCVMMAQGEPMFLDLKREPQAELFASVLGLDRWLDYSSRASRMASAQDQIARRLESEEAELRGKLSEQEDWTDPMAAWDAQHKGKIDDLFIQHERLTTDIKRLETQSAEAAERVSDLRERLRGFLPETEMHASRVKDYRASVDDLRDQSQALNAQAEALAAGVDFLADHDHCPTCDLDLDHDIKLAAMERKNDELQKLVRRANWLRDGHDKAKHNLLAAERLEERHLLVVAQARDRLDEAERDGRDLKRRIDQLDHELDRIEDEAERLEKESNPFRIMQRQAQERTRTHQDRLSAVRQGLDRARELYSLYSFWVRGFKELRLQQIAEALTELEIEVNSEIAALGLAGWELRFEVDRETKAGTVQRGFSVTVLSPGNKKFVPWESWSGGEKQRLRIAGTMGLSNLIRSRLNVELDFEVWDEPSQGLSSVGVIDLLSALERRARVEGRVIFVVDHTSRGFGGFSGEITVIKDEHGSRIEQS